MHRCINVSLQSSQPNPSFYWYGGTWIVPSLNPCFILFCTFIGPAKTYVRTVLTFSCNIYLCFLTISLTVYSNWVCSLHTFNWKSGYKLSVVVFYFLHCVGGGIELSVHWLCNGLDDPGFQSWKRQETFLFSRTFRPTGAHPAYHWVTQFVPRSKVARVSSFITTHLHSLLRLRLSDFPQYTFVECVWKTLLTSYTLFPLYLP